jgi:hypothetical protein
MPFGNRLDCALCGGSYIADVVVSHWRRKHHHPGTRRQL